MCSSGKCVDTRSLQFVNPRFSSPPQTTWSSPLNASPPFSPPFPPFSRILPSQKEVWCQSTSSFSLLDTTPPQWGHPRCVCACVCVHARACVRVCVHARACVSVCTCVCVHARACVCVCVCMHDMHVYECAAGMITCIRLFRGKGYSSQ